MNTSAFSFRLTLLTAAALSFCPSMQASHLSPEQALARVATAKNMPAKIKSMNRTARLAATVGQVYVFTQGTEGFMILPADDNVPAVLGYGDNGTYEPGANAQLDYWLDYYSRQIRYASAHGITAPARAAAERPSIEPIVKTEWNQESPYNALCPRVNGHATVTGCVATAMAQMIRTHRHPYRPTGRHSYQWHAEYRGFSVDSTLAIDYDSISFDFGNMPYVYDKHSTAVEKNAVAQLMLACGISVDMGYNIGDSGAATMKMGTALIEYFKYDKSIWMPIRNYYALDQWEDMIYSDLSKGLPVLYAGYGTGGGHQFICDGYSSDGYFHFNWGWGGMSNGYFLLDALNPNSLGVGGGAGGFNYSQQLTLNVTPETADAKYTYLVYCGGFKTADTAPAAGSDVTFGGTYFNYSLHALPAGTYYGIEIISADNDTTYVRGSETMRLAPMDGQESFRVQWPALADGTYTVSPALKDEYGQWLAIHSPLDGHGSYTATVSGGATVLSQQPLPQVAATAISLNSKLYAGTQCSVSFTVTNRGDSEYIWNVAPALLDSAGTIVSVAPALEVDLQGGASRVIDNYILTFTPSATSAAKARASAPADTLPAGNYTLTVINTADKSEIASAAERVSVVMADKPADTSVSVSDFSVNGGKDITEGESAEFTFRLSCTGGFVDKDVYIFVYKDGGSRYDVMSHTFEAPLISAGQSTQESAMVDLSGLGEGTYRAYVYYGDSFEGAPAQFRIVAATLLSVGDIAADAGISAPAIYDLGGRRLRAIPPSTPVIVNGRLTIFR